MPRSSAEPAELDRIERYYDTVPRANAIVEEYDGLTLFVSTGGFPYYARPTLGDATDITPAAVGRVRDRQRELGVPEAFEWVHDLRPGLADAVAATGMAVCPLPLMVCRRPDTVPAPAPGVRVRMLAATDPAIPAVQAAIGVGFSAPGTGVGPAGDAERAAATAENGHEGIRNRIAAGYTALAAAFGPAGAMAGGSYSARDEVAEITGVATLPAYRRRGVGAAVTATLVTHARRRGVSLVFLSAGSEDIARVYARTGFERVATACIASAPSAD